MDSLDRERRYDTIAEIENLIAEKLSNGKSTLKAVTESLSEYYGENIESWNILDLDEVQYSVLVNICERYKIEIRVALCYPNLIKED